MAKLICQNCGMEVRVEGLGAICPECGQLVMIGQETIAEIDPVGAAEQKLEAQPLPSSYVSPDTSRPDAPPYNLYFIIGALLAVVIVLVATIIILLSGDRTPAPVVIVPPPPAVSTRPAATPAEGSDWFSENPLPAARPGRRGTGGSGAGGTGEGGSESATAVPGGAQPPPALQQPPSPPAATAEAPPPPPHIDLALIKLRRQPAASVRVTDDQIGNSLQQAIVFLNSQFGQSRLNGADRMNEEVFQGLDALAVYALLTAGQAVNDPDLTPQNSRVKEWLDRLKEMPMSGDKATYSRSLRISALGVFNRPEDRGAIETDVKWLLQSSMGGAYSYGMPPPNRTHDSNNWDNSNSQYGALGIWAASEAGIRVPSTYWNEVEQHWTSTQTYSGGWGYGAGATVSTLSMSAAGTTMLFVARDQPLLEAGGAIPYVPLSKPIQRALEWLDEGNNAVKIEGHRGYTLYGIERAGLASGYKYFGTHDWYAELAKRTLAEQQKDGSWAGADGPVAETAFSMLFLARGRHPVLMTKLKFDGNWNNRPRDLAAFSRFASYQLERSLNWEVADIARQWWEWSDSPVLLITSDKPPEFKENDVEKLRRFAQSGGLVLLNAEREGAAFDTFAADLARQMFPDYPFEAIAPSHPVYSAAVPMQNKPPLTGVSNGSRLMFVYSPRDLTRSWQVRPSRNQRAASDLALNLCIYATGRRDLRNRLASTYLPETTDVPAGVVPAMRIRYDGNWDPEPAAWPRMSILLQNRTGIALNLIPTILRDVDYATAPIAILTGTGNLNAVPDEDAMALRQFVNDGGVLLVDPCGGSRQFFTAVQNWLTSKAFPSGQFEPLPSDQAMLTASRAGMQDLTQPLVRPQSPKDVQLLSLSSGKGRVILSQIDLTTGILGATPVGIVGYQPDYAQDLVQNIVLWTIGHIPGATPQSAASTTATQ